MCNYDPFINLHVHSSLSSDGISTPEKLVETVATMGQTHLAITEHGSLGSMVDLYFACKEKGIKPIFGNEMYLHYGNDAESGLPIVNHITIISLDNQGLDNLVKLNNVSHENTYRRKSGSIPLATMDMFYSYRKGLMVFTGCPASALFKGTYQEALTYTTTLCNIFGLDNVAVELMFSMSEKQYIYRPLDVAKDLSLPIVITTDAHFATQDLADVHPTMVKAKKGFDYESSTLFLHSYDEIKKTALEYISESQFNASMNTIRKIADRIQPIQIESEPVLPVDDNVWPTLYQDTLELLEHDILENQDTEEIRRARFAKELEIITNSGFEKYFCLLYDIIAFCKREGIKFNVRGSAAGCYILYLWKISSLDPIRYNLLFERFLNVYRLDYPDVDVDIESNRREDVLKYAWEKWAMRGVATYSTYNHKSLVHDLCRVLNLDKSLELSASEGDETSPAFLKLSETNPLFKKAYEECIGQIRHRGKHAGAICSIRNLSVPLERFESEIPLIAFSESGAIKTLSKVGGVKLDVLGVRELDRLAMMEKLTGHKPPIKPEDYPIEIYDTICDGKLTGLFQLGSSQGIRDLTNKIQPRTFEDISLISALYRPGALDAFDIDTLVSYKDNPRTLHPVIDKLLSKSYSIMIYQENVMDIFAEITGMGLAGADIARRKLTPKTLKVLDDPKWVADRDKLYEEFLEKGQQRGYELDLLKELWHNIVTFARYGFNLAHAASYAYLTIQGAWFRTYYPEEFFTSLLHSELLDGGHSLQQYIFEAVVNGLTIKMPHINTSDDSFVLKDKNIYLPLSVIKGLGEATLQAILAIRNEKVKFKTFKELNDSITPRQMNKTIRAKIHCIGGFEGIDGNPEDFGIDVQLSKAFTTFDVIGFMIPSEAMIREINKYKDNPVVFSGIISEKIAKKTKTNKAMCRVILAPYGGFWYFVPDEKFDKLKKGDFIKATTNSYNKVESVVRYKLIHE